MVEIVITLWVDPEFMGMPVELTDGSQFPSWFEARATVDDVPVTLTIHVENGRPVLTSLTVDRPRHSTGDLEASTVHKLPVGQLVRAAVEQGGYLMERTGHAGASGASALRARGRRSITDDLLREVAAVVQDDPLGEPNQAVQRQLHTSSRTASRWIAAAKRRGFLSDTSEED